MALQAANNMVGPEKYIDDEEKKRTESSWAQGAQMAKTPHFIPTERTFQHIYTFAVHNFKSANPFLDETNKSQRYMLLNNMIFKN